MGFSFDFTNGNIDIVYTPEGEVMPDWELMEKINNCPEFLQVRSKPEEGQLYFAYSIKDKTNMLAWRDMASPEQNREIGMRISMSMENLARNGFPMDKIVQENRYMFVDDFDGTVKFICIPVKPMEKEEKIARDTETMELQKPEKKELERAKVLLQKPGSLEDPEPEETPIAPEMPQKSELVENQEEEDEWKLPDDLKVEDNWDLPKEESFDQVETPAVEDFEKLQESPLPDVAPEPDPKAVYDSYTNASQVEKEPAVAPDDETVSSEEIGEDDMPEPAPGAYYTPHTPEPEPVPESRYTPELEPVPEPRYTPEPESVPESRYTPEPEPVPEPRYTPEPEPVPEPRYTPEPEPVPEPRYTPVPEPNYTPEPNPVPENHYRPESHYAPEHNFAPENSYRPEPHYAPEQNYAPEQDNYNDYGDDGDGGTVYLDDFDEGDGETVMLIARPDGNAYLERLQTREIFHIYKNITKIGKQKATADICLTGNPTFSRQHCTISYSMGIYYIKDNGSLNHTYLDGQMLRPNEGCRLNNNSRIRISNEEFIFRTGEA